MPDNPKIQSPQKNKKIADKQQITKINLFFLEYFRLVALAIVLLFFTVCFFYFLKPKYDSIREDIAESYENKQAEYEQLENYYRNLSRYIDAYNNLSQTDKNRIDMMVPEDDSYKYLYYFVDDIVGQHNMILKTLEVSLDKDGAASTKKAVTPKTAEEKFADRQNTISVAANIIGVNYNNLKSLLSALENNLRLIDVNNIDFNPDTRTAALEMTLYYLRPEESTPLSS